MKYKMKAGYPGLPVLNILLSFYVRRQQGRKENL